MDYKLDPPDDPPEIPERFIEMATEEYTDAIRERAAELWEDSKYQAVNDN